MFANGKVIGIVSRSNLIQALALSKPAVGFRRESDPTDFGRRNVIVEDGVVHLWGLVGSEAEHKALMRLPKRFRRYLTWSTR